MIKNSQGFSLAELMVVIAILAIMALIVAPNIATGLPTYRIKAATSDCIAQLRNARHRAIKEKRDVEVFFNADRMALEIENRRLPVKGSFTEQYGSGVGFGNFVRPKGIAVGEEGFIYVTDFAFNNFQLFDADFTLLTFVGTGGAAPGSFKGAFGIAVQGERIAVVDQLGARVQVFRFLESPTGE